jgi:hypothetical protein
MSTLTTQQTCSHGTQAAIDRLAQEIVSSGYEMLGDEVYNEPQWAALGDVASAVGASLTKPRFEHGPVRGGKVECPLAGDWWDVLTAEGLTWCDGCQQELPAPAAVQTAPAAVAAVPVEESMEPIEVTLLWHERGSYRCREEIDVEEFVRMLRGECPYGGIPADPKGIFTDLAESGTVGDYAARIREAMADEGRQGALSRLLEYYFTDNLPDSSSSYVKTLDGSNAVDAVRLTD